MNVYRTNVLQLFEHLQIICQKYVVIYHQKLMNNQMFSLFIALITQNNFILYFFILCLPFCLPTCISGCRLHKSRKVACILWNSVWHIVGNQQIFVEEMTEATCSLRGGNPSAAVRTEDEGRLDV